MGHLAPLGLKKGMTWYDYEHGIRGLKCEVILC